MGRAHTAFLLLALAVWAALGAAGCHAPRFSGEERVVRSRFYEIRTDAGPEIERDVGPFLDRTVERLARRIGLPLPPEGALAAVIFSQPKDFEDFAERHLSGGAIAGFYCAAGGEIALDVAVLTVKDLEQLIEHTEALARRGGPLADLAESARRLREALPDFALVESYQRVLDLKVIAHEVTHQLLYANGYSRHPVWLREGLADLHSLRVVDPVDLPEPLRKPCALLRRELECRAALVLAVRALYGKPVFEGEPLAKVTWRDRNYAAHLALCRFLAERYPALLEDLVRQRPSPQAVPARRLEREIALWARAQALDLLTRRVGDDAARFREALLKAPDETTRGVIERSIPRLFLNESLDDFDLDRLEAR